MAARFNLPIEDIVSAIDSNLPREIAEFIKDIINSKNLDVNIVIFIVSAFILASNGPMSMITGSNLLYKIKDKDIVSTRIKAIIMTMFLVLLLMFVLIVPLFGNQIVNTLVNLVENDTIDNSIKVAYNILKYPLSIFIIFFFIKLLYTMAPDKKIRSMHTTRGAIFTTIGWVISTEIYSLYVSKFVNYSVLYGSVAHLIVLFIWIYLLSYVFVLGMAINASSVVEEE
jgi:membrane protein